MKKMIIALAMFAGSTMVATSAMAVEPVIVPAATTIDVKEFVSLTPPDSSFTDVCGIEEQTITYVDSKGVLSQTTYQRQGTGCNG